MDVIIPAIRFACGAVLLFGGSEIVLRSRHEKLGTVCLGSGLFCLFGWPW